MSWASPPTFVAGTVCTAANLNILSNDLTFLAGTSGAIVSTSESTTSTSFTDLATVGPSVTCNTGAHALVILTAQLGIVSGAAGPEMGFVVSGATTIAASAAQSLAFVPASSGAPLQASALFVVNLNAGVNGFTAKYLSTNGAAASFANRTLTVVPLP